VVSLIPVVPAFETMGPPRLTRGRCRRALQCETRAARRWRHSSSGAPGKNDEDGIRLSPAAVPGDPFGGAGRGCRVLFNREPGAHALLPSLPAPTRAPLALRVVLAWVRARWEIGDYLKAIPPQVGEVGGNLLSCSRVSWVTWLEWRRHCIWLTIS